MAGNEGVNLGFRFPKIKMMMIEIRKCHKQLARSGLCMRTFGSLDGRYAYRHRWNRTPVQNMYWKRYKIKITKIHSIGTTVSNKNTTHNYQQKITGTNTTIVNFLSRVHQVLGARSLVCGLLGCRLRCHFCCGSWNQRQKERWCMRNSRKDGSVGL